MEKTKFGVLYCGSSVMGKMGLRQLEALKENDTLIPYPCECISLSLFTPAIRVAINLAVNNYTTMLCRIIDSFSNGEIKCF